MVFIITAMEDQTCRENDERSRRCEAKGNHHITRGVPDLLLVTNKDHKIEASFMLYLWDMLEKQTMKE